MLRRILASPACAPYLALIVLPLLVHAVELTGWLSSNPIYLTAGLTADWMSNGPVRGLPGWIDGNSGVTLQALGRLAARDWHAGIIPWWNPYSGVGMPLAVGVLARPRGGKELVIDVVIFVPDEQV